MFSQPRQQGKGDTMTTNTQTGEPLPLWSDDAIINLLTRDPKQFSLVVRVRNSYEGERALLRQQLAETERDLDIASDDAMIQNNALIKAEAEVARLKALVDEAEWEPVPDGKHGAQHRGEYIQIDREWLTITAYDILDDSEGITSSVAMPEGWQLRRRKETP
jgi:hypothetical protein